MTLLIFLVTLISVIPVPWSDAFGPLCPSLRRNEQHLSLRSTMRNSPVTLLSGVDDEQGVTVEEDATADKDVGPAFATTDDLGDESATLGEAGGTAPKQVLMITRDMKRTMVEELGYKRAEVESIRVELVAEIIENRIRCPSEGMPAEWIDKELECMKKSIEETNSNSMMDRLESESKYPLKFPLLAVSLVLFGKGFSDALITLIKVNIDFPGASLTAQFQGIPVLAVDFFCVAAGAAIGLWTWKTMK